MSDDRRPLVLHVIHHLVTGGMENGLVNLVNNMPEQRWRHAIACIEDYSNFRDRIVRRDVDVFSLHRSKTGIWALRRALFELCRRLRPAIVHSRNQSGLDALPSAWLAGVPHRVHGEHGWDVADLHGERLRPALLRRLHSPLVDRYVTVSDQLRRYLVERIHIAPSRIVRIYNGVDTDRFAPAPSKPLDVLPPGFATDHSIVVGTVGRIQAVKDQATLVRAFAALVTRDELAFSRLRLAIVGDGPLLDNLRELAGSLGVAHACWFAGNAQNVESILRTFDVFVLPSLGEGISNTVLEAMATALPVLVTPVGGNAEIVDDGVTGRFFPVGDVATLARLLQDYVLDASARKIHGQRARERAIARFSLCAMVSNYGRLYEALREHRPAAGAAWP